MKKPLFIKNAPIDEKRIDFIERLIGRLMVRAKDTTKVAMAPYPISWSGVGEDALRYMFCTNGEIVKLMSSLDSKPKGQVELVVNLKGAEAWRSQSFTISEIDEIKLNMPISGGDKLTVRVIFSDEKDSQIRFWISLLWVPTLQDAKVKQFAISELENDLLAE